MTDLEAWAQARGLDLAAHVAAIEAEAVRGRTAELEKAHKKWMKQLDKEIAAAGDLPAPLATGTIRSGQVCPERGG